MLRAITEFAIRALKIETAVKEAAPCLDIATAEVAATVCVVACTDVDSIDVSAPAANTDANAIDIA